MKIWVLGSFVQSPLGSGMFSADFTPRSAGVSGFSVSHFRKHKPGPIRQEISAVCLEGENQKTHGQIPTDNMLSPLLAVGQPLGPAGAAAAVARSRTRGCKWSADAESPKLTSPSPLSFTGKLLTPHIVAPSLREYSLALIHGVNALRHSALAASRCPGPKVCRV